MARLVHGRGVAVALRTTRRAVVTALALPDPRRAVVTALALALAALAGLGLGAPAAAGAATLTADYRFAGTYASSVAGAPALTPLGPGGNSFRTESVLGSRQQVLTFPEGNGVTLAPTAGVAPSDAYTVAVLARLADTSGYRRYVDFKNGTSDTGLYDLNGNLDFYDYGGGQLAPIKPDVYATVVLTRSPAGQLVGYVDGLQQFSFDDSSSGLGVISPEGVLRFFRDNDTGSATSEHAAGAVARIRVWNGPLNPVEVAGLAAGSGPTPTPVLGKSVGAKVQSGRVTVVLPGTTTPVPLAQLGSLPVGTTVDATAGVARITSAAGGRAVQTGDFAGGVFKVRQNAAEHGVTELGLVDPPAATRSCTAPATTAHTSAGRRLPPKVLALLHATVKGKFRTRGRFSSATVRGTRWDTIDRCDGTLTRVFSGVVVVRDLRRHRQVVLRPGQSYLVRAA
ncbi:MAG: hypothetical protein QOE27_321 [Solirubrobacteraceae bacterium]|nr:hypothetical protein [Solirubrobacteraceae bacterium]